METSDLKREIIELQQYTEGHRAGRETHAQSCGELQVRRSICVLLICSLFAIGFASAARADEYQYPIRFDPSSHSGLSMSATFLAGMLPGGLGTIDPASVQILNAPA
jgi:hypothetical protein